MSPNLQSPVRTQMLVSVLNHNLSNEHYVSNSTEGRPSGRRQVFVQTDSGSVLGMELDRGDNAHTVKKRLQMVLNVPTEESCLTFGDIILKNDLRAVRNYSPLRLTRCFMHRSSSTPCLSPTAKDLQQRDRSGPIEILGCSSYCIHVKKLVEEVAQAINNDINPVPVHGGLGGAYYFRNNKGHNIAIVKPTDEEPFAPNNPKGFVGKALGQPGLKQSVRVGETGIREVAAYLLDYDHFANVPPTALVKITHPSFHVNEGVNCSIKDNDRATAVSKIASIQQYISHDFDASDHGTSSFPVAAVHRIGMLDVRIFNTDRHAGNLLVRKINGGTGRISMQTDLIPIDHGLCLPESLEDPYFEWIHWSQASIPFSEDELEYIKNLDPVKDSEMLQKELPMICEACLRVLVLSTIFLKEAANFGLCLAEIGEMMSREFRGMEEEPSELELVCIDARRLVAERDSYSPNLESVEDDVTHFSIFCENYEKMMLNGPLNYNFGLIEGSSRNPLSKLDESLEEYDGEERSVYNKSCFLPVAKQLSTASKLSMSLEDVTLSEKGHQDHGGIPKIDYAVRTDDSGGGNGVQNVASRSANEQFPPSASFVKLADMGEREWAAFLVQFHALLKDAFSHRKCETACQRQKQRLVTSCQF